MGVVGFLGKKTIQAAVVFVVIAFVPGLPPHNMEFTAFSVKPTLPLEGKLSVNNKLDNAERLFENELKGPEGLAVYKNELYTGIHGGHIVKIKNNKIVPVIKFGQACDGLFEEEKCGRVLGIRFDKRGIMYAVDAYYGIFKVNMTTGEIETIVKKDEIVEGKPVKLPNSIDFGRDGSLYWSISSTSHELFDGLYTLLGDGNGRLMKTNPKTKTHEVLIDNLHFANGVVLSQDESFVLVAETARARVMRYHLKGPKKGKVDVFIDGLPGLPDNLQRDPKTGEFLIPLIKPIEKNYPHLPFVLSPYPILRKFIVRVAALIELSIKFFNDLYPSVYFKRAIHFVGHFESINIVAGKRVTIIRANENGDIVSSLHATDGKISDICDIEYFNGAYYLASPFNPYLARVTAS